VTGSRYARGVKRIGLLGLVFLGLPLCASAEAADKAAITILKPNTHVRFLDIRCVARVKTYDYLSCASAGEYELAFSKQNVVIVHAADRRVVYHSRPKLLRGAAAGASARGAITLKPNSHIRFKEVECVTRVTTYHYLTCVSPGNYEVAFSKENVIVVRARDGHILYHTPYK
jgi:coenzyme F420-reducing hydrogenase delta subunit